MARPVTDEVVERDIMVVCLCFLARGDRVAQMVIAPVVQVKWNEIEALDETHRGVGGFGSSGAR